VLVLFTAAAAFALPRVSRINTRWAGIALISGISIGALVPFLPPMPARATFVEGFAPALGYTAVAEVALCGLLYRPLRNVERRKAILGYSAIAAGVTAVILWPIGYAICGQIVSIQDAITFTTRHGSYSRVWPIGCAVTALLWIIAGIVNLIRRSPVIPDFLQRFVKSGRTVAAVMFVLYAVYATTITVWDQRLDHSLRENAGHEIAQASAKTDRPWPPPTDFSAAR